MFPCVRSKRFKKLLVRLFRRLAALFREIQAASGEWMNEFVRPPDARRDDRALLPTVDIIKRTIRRSWTISNPTPRWSAMRASPDMRPYNSLPRRRDVADYPTLALHRGVGVETPTACGRRRSPRRTQSEEMYDERGGGGGGSPIRLGAATARRRSPKMMMMMMMNNADACSSEEGSSKEEDSPKAKRMLTPDALRKYDRFQAEKHVSFDSTASNARHAVLSENRPSTNRIPARRRQEDCSNSSEELTTVQHDRASNGAGVAADTAQEASGRPWEAAMAPDGDDYRLVFVSSSDGSSKEETSSSKDEDDNDSSSTASSFPIDECDWDYFEPGARPGAAAAAAAAAVVSWSPPVGSPSVCRRSGAAAADEPPIDSPASPDGVLHQHVPPDDRPATPLKGHDDPSSSRRLYVEQSCRTCGATSQFIPIPVPVPVPFPVPALWRLRVPPLGLRSYLAQAALAWTTLGAATPPPADNERYPLCEPPEVAVAVPVPPPDSDSSSEDGRRSYQVSGTERVSDEEGSVMEDDMTSSGGGTGGGTDSDSDAAGGGKTKRFSKIFVVNKNASNSSCTSGTDTSDDDTDTEMNCTVVLVNVKPIEEGADAECDNDNGVGGCERDATRSTELSEYLELSSPGLSDVSAESVNSSDLEQEKVLHGNYQGTIAGSKDKVVPDDSVDPGIPTNVHLSQYDVKLMTGNFLKEETLSFIEDCSTGPLENSTEEAFESQNHEDSNFYPFKSPNFDCTNQATPAYCAKEITKNFLEVERSTANVIANEEPLQYESNDIVDSESKFSTFSTVLEKVDESPEPKQNVSSDAIEEIVSTDNKSVSLLTSPDEPILDEKNVEMLDLSQEEGTVSSPVEKTSSTDNRRDVVPSLITLEELNHAIKSDFDEDNVEMLDLGQEDDTISGTVEKTSSTGSTKDVVPSLITLEELNHAMESDFDAEACVGSNLKEIDGTNHAIIEENGNETSTNVTQNDVVPSTSETNDPNESFENSTALEESPDLNQIDGDSIEEKNSTTDDHPTPSLISIDEIIATADKHSSDSGTTVAENPDSTDNSPTSPASFPAVARENSPDRTIAGTNSTAVDDGGTQRPLARHGPEIRSVEDRVRKRDSPPEGNRLDGTTRSSGTRPVVGEPSSGRYTSLVMITRDAPPRRHRVSVVTSETTTVTTSMTSKEGDDGEDAATEDVAASAGGVVVVRHTNGRETSDGTLDGYYANGMQDRRDGDGVRVVTGAETLSAFEEGLADDDSWVENLSHNDEEEEEDEDEDEFATNSGTEDSSSGDEVTLTCSAAAAAADREEDLRGYHRAAIDFTLHTIVEESCEESEPEPKQARPPPTDLEKYFFFDIGAAASEATSREDNCSETSSIYSEGMESIGFGDDAPNCVEDSAEPVELASSRLEKYFLSGFMGFAGERRDSDGSVGSDSEGRPSPEQRRKRLVRARGTGRSHSSSLDNLVDSTVSEQTIEAHASCEDPSSSDDEHSDNGSEKFDGQFDTIKRKKSKKPNKGTPVDESKNSGMDEDGCETPQPTEAQSNLVTAKNQQSRDSGFVGSCDDLVREQKDAGGAAPDVQTIAKPDLEDIKEEKKHEEKPVYSLSLPPTTSLTRKDSFNNWSSDEETNLMMCKMRQFFKTMVAKPSVTQNAPNATPHRAEIAATKRSKPPQLVYFENELTRLMKSVPGIRDDQVREIVEYLSSEDAWSDSYDSSDYTSSDLEATTSQQTALQRQISDSCKRIIDKFDAATVDDEGDEGDGGIADGSNKETAFVYQKLVASFGKMVDATPIATTAHNSPPLIAKVMHHIGGRLVALMHEVSSGESHAGGGGDSPKTKHYHRRLQHKISSASSTTTEDDSTEFRADESPYKHPSLPRSKSHDLLVHETRGGAGAQSGDAVEEKEASDCERFSWRGSFESALLASDSRNRLSLLDGSASGSALAIAAKRRSAGDLLFSHTKSLSREQLDRVRSCGSIGAEDAGRSCWARPNRRRSSVPDAASCGGSGGSADDEDGDGDAGGGRSTLPRSLMAGGVATTTTNSLPRLPTGGCYQKGAQSAMNAKSARYRPPGFGRLMAAAPKRAVSAPGLQPVHQRRGRRSQLCNVPDGEFRLGCLMGEIYGKIRGKFERAMRHETYHTFGTGIEQLDDEYCCCCCCGISAIFKTIFRRCCRGKSADDEEVDDLECALVDYVQEAKDCAPDDKRPVRIIVSKRELLDRRNLRNNAENGTEKKTENSENDEENANAESKEFEQIINDDNAPAENCSNTPEIQDEAGVVEAHSSPMLASSTPKTAPKSAKLSPASSSAGVRRTASKASQDWHNDDDFERLGHARSSLSTLGARSDSMASVYSGAGEGRYGTVAVRGQVEFGLQYDYKAGDLEIQIKQCKDLAPVDTKRNRSDPYVKVYLLPDKSKSGKRKTKVKKHTLNPAFDECLKFHTSLADLETRTLWLTVWHSDMFGRNDFLGEVAMTLENKVFDDPTPRWYQLQERTEPFEEVPTYRGDVIVCLKFVPPDMTLPKKGKRSRGALHVLVKEAKALSAVKANGTSDPFCKSYLLPDKGRSSKQKTPVAKRSVNPVWNHTFVYDDVTLQELSERCLELTVWDHDRLASNEFLGGVRFSLGTGKHHGKPADWMDSSGRELSLWKDMLEKPNFWVEGALSLRSTLETRCS
ncbi:unnamed protein product [Phyllotreta striolata]|uniref:C2 domain-containing protein n=1 Tax=Phyllotreta striolata TaxID=444603 RepID=A0A9N9TM63_PHYSR|nr:unnamed protein product [Phyllotreta striolata]